MDARIEEFLSGYPEQAYTNALFMREVVLETLPDVMEQLDIPAKMVAYCYRQKYAEMVCTIIPSKKGLKLGFYRGIDLSDPHQLLEGTGKISRYIEIRNEEQIKSEAVKQLLKSAYEAYKKRMGIQ